MSTTRKILLGGAAMGAAALTAASTAWACSPSGFITVRAGDLPRGQLEVTGSGYETQYGTIELRYGSTGGPLLATVTGQADEKWVSFTTVVTLPPSPPGDYYVWAVQRRSGGGLSPYHATAEITVAAEPPPTSVPTGGPSTTTATSPTSPTSAAQQPVLLSPPTVAAPVGDRTGPVVVVVAPTTPGVVGIQAPTALPNDPVGGTAALLPPDGPAPRQLAPGSSDETPPADGTPADVRSLWSGLDTTGGSDSGPNLLEPPAAPPNPPTLGLALAGLGLAGLSGAAWALMAPRRRAALARRR